MENYYECPRCHNVFPSFNKIMHDAICTEKNPIPLNNNNLAAPAPIGNKEESINQLTSFFNNININKENNINNNNDKFNFNFYNNNNNNINNNNYFNNIINEPPKDNFPQTFVCEICHEMLMEKERNDHMLCHNLEKEDKKNEIRISRIDVEEQKEIEKQIEDNKRNMINQQRINQNNLNNNNNFNNISNINNNINKNNIKDRRNINNNNNNHIQINQNISNNPNRDDNANINQINNQNNEIRNIRRYRRSYSNNFPNYDIPFPNDLITFNRHRERQRLVPIIDENGDNKVRATDKEILNNLPETKIEDESKLESEKKNCVICLEDFKNKDKAIILPCIHLFHKNCINNWLKTKNICPICKFKLTRSNINSQNNNFQ